MATPVYDPFIGHGSVPFHVRRPSPVHPFTQNLAVLLRDTFNEPGQVKTEWRALVRSEVGTRRIGRTLRNRMYSPAIDLAVGPYATYRRFADEYDRMVDCSVDMIEAMQRFYRANLRRFRSDYAAPPFGRLCTFNHNARCFLAIEIEKGNQDPKHLICSLMIASTLGRVGIIVAWNQRRLNDLLRGREFLSHMQSLGKNSFDTTNLLFLTREQILTVLER